MNDNTVSEGPQLSEDPPPPPPERFSLPTLSRSDRSAFRDASLDTNTNVSPLQRDVDVVLTKQTRRKARSYATFRRLLTVEGSPNRKHYERGLKCAHVRFQDVDGELSSWYCQSRACVTCATIRSADLRATYEPHVRGWGAQAHMVVLTAPNCHVEDLRSTHGDRLRLFDRAFKRVKRRHPDAKAIRTTEVACRTRRSDRIHHHFHLIVNTYAVAVAIEEEWLNLSEDSSHKGQCIQKADKDALIELVKYSVKGIADQRPDRQLSPALLDAILVATRGLKLASTHGFSPSDTYDEDQVFEGLRTHLRASKRIGEIVFWTYCHQLGEYIDYSTGELLVDKPILASGVGFA